MDKKDCFILGKIGRPHGLTGEMQIKIDADDPEYYEDVEVIYIDRKGQLSPFFVEYLHLKSNKALIKLEDSEDVDMARTFQDCTVYLPLTELQDPGDSYYLHELENFTVKILPEKSFLGKVVSIYDNGAYELLGVLLSTEEEVFIPLVDAFVKEVNKDQSEIYVELPEGYLEMNTSSGKEEEQE